MGSFAHFGSHGGVEVQGWQWSSLCYPYNAKGYTDGGLQDLYGYTHGEDRDSKEDPPAIVLAGVVQGCCCRSCSESQKAAPRSVLRVSLVPLPVMKSPFERIEWTL